LSGGDGGVGQSNQSWRKIAVYDGWRDRVLERDQYKCQECGCSDVKFLEAHHIKKADDYPELSYDLGNGITYCRSCHYKKERK
jgi:5-methylcytosine-specific restriction endonuclease McrA